MDRKGGTDASDSGKEGEPKKKDTENDFQIKYKKDWKSDSAPVWI